MLKTDIIYIAGSQFIVHRDIVYKYEKLYDELLNKWVPVYSTILALSGTQAWKELEIPISFNIHNPFLRIELSDYL